MAHDLESNGTRRIGVVVGRFQVAELTDGHRLLIQKALDDNHSVLIFLGSPSEEKRDTRNPLTFEMREQMILSTFPEDKNRLFINPIEDKHFFPLWVFNLDCKIILMGHMISQIQHVEEDGGMKRHYTLYGGRDSFLKGYRKFSYSHHETVDVNFGIPEVSGSNQREDIFNDAPNIYSEDFFQGQRYNQKNGADPIDSVDFRKGVIYQTFVDELIKKHKETD